MNILKFIEKLGSFYSLTWKVSVCIECVLSYCIENGLHIVWNIFENSKLLHSHWLLNVWILKFPQYPRLAIWFFLLLVWCMMHHGCSMPLWNWRTLNKNDEIRSYASTLLVLPAQVLDLHLGVGLWPPVSERVRTMGCAEKQSGFFYLDFIATSKGPCAFFSQR